MEILQLTIAGVAIGCIYALIALGFVLIYKATEVVNFAQGDVMMLGAFVAFTFASLWKLPFFLAVLLAIVVLAIVGAVFDRFLLRPIIGQPTFAAVMVTLALGMVIRGVATMIPGWGTDTYALKAPYSDGVLRTAGVSISTDHIAIIVLTTVV